MSILAREQVPNQIMQIGERLGAVDFKETDTKNETYETWAAVVAAHVDGKE
jgi:hypothetical protein